MPTLSDCVLIRRLGFWAAILMSFFVSTAPARAADSVTLISITGIQLGKSEFVEGVSLKTQNLRILAICHIPAGWSVSVSGPAGTTGAIDAGASGGVAALGQGDLGELRAFFLARKSEVPTAAITGTIDIEIRGDQPDTAERQLTSSNFAMVPGDQCPAVRAWSSGDSSGDSALN